jgi:hypothetical protein
VADRALELVKQLRGLLKGLGIDPDALEVRELTGKLLEALTLLCRAGERFMNSADENRRRPAHQHGDR